MERHPTADEIERRMALLSTNPKKLARNAGVGETYVRDLLTGRSRNPTIDKLQKIAGALGCTVDDLERSFAEGAPKADLPAVVQSAPAGYAAVAFLSSRAGMGGGQMVDSSIYGEPKYFEESFIQHDLRASPADLIVVQVEGQSMEPMLQNGDTVIVDRRKCSVIEPGIFVLFDGDGVVCKWVERVHGADEPTIRIKSENSRFSDYEVLAESCQIVGRVVWFARRL